LSSCKGTSTACTIEEKALGPCSPSTNPARRRQCVAQLGWGGRAGCLHRPPAKGNAGYFRRALCARLRLARRRTSSPATRPGASPPTSRSCRLARQAGSSLDCYGAAVRQVTVHGAGRGSAFECLLFGLPIEPDDAGLLCAHYRPKSECREDGHRECVHHCDLLKGRLIDLRRQ